MHLVWLSSKHLRFLPLGLLKPTILFSHFRLKREVTVQIKNRWSPVFASKSNRSDGSNEKSVSDDTSAPPLLTILAGLVVFLFAGYVMISVMTWLLGLIFNPPTLNWAQVCLEFLLLGYSSRNEMQEFPTPFYITCNNSNQCGACGEDFALWLHVMNAIALGSHLTLWSSVGILH